MEVDIAPFLDAGEQDAVGLYDYYYEGDHYTFRESSEQLKARTYIESPDSVWFVTGCGNLDNSPLASAAVQYFLSRDRSVFFCIGPSGGYEPWTPPVV